jgi:hypothetical protein
VDQGGVIVVASVILFALLTQVNPGDVVAVPPTAVAPNGGQ